MTISDKDLFLAILSMDAYNRGYEPGITLSGNTIGNATLTVDSAILTVNGARIDEPAGFYAAAYDTNSWGTVISYRGTDSFVTLPGNEGFFTAAGQEFLLIDMPIYSGSFDEDELSLASQFRRTVGESLSTNTEITMTGHSLGGALAGFTGALFGDQTVAIDHIVLDCSRI